MSTQERGNHAAAPSDSCPCRTRLPRWAAILSTGRSPTLAAILTQEGVIFYGGISHHRLPELGRAPSHSRARSLGSDPGGPRGSVHVVERKVEGYD